MYYYYIIYILLYFFFLFGFRNSENSIFIFRINKFFLQINFKYYKKNLNPNIFFYIFLFRINLDKNKIFRCLIYLDEKKKKKKKKK